MSYKELLADIDNAVTYYRNGGTIQSVADFYGCSSTFVFRHFKQNGVDMSKSGWRFIKRKFGVTPDELVKMYNSGMWKNEIAAKTGISEGAVGKYLAKIGIPIADNRSAAMSERLARMTADERSALAAPAHDAVRGMIRTESNLIKGALGRERVARLGSKAERQLYDLLIARGVNPVIQKAVWKYNVDLTIGSVAVEVTGRDRKPAHYAYLRERTKYLANSGLVLVYLWASSVIPVQCGAADYIVALSERASRDPSLSSQYRVIRCDGQLVFTGSPDNDDLPGIFSAIRGTYSGECYVRPTKNAVVTE